MAQDYVVQVHGIVCSFCALGVAKKVAKLSFVDRSKHKKGVFVDIENQQVTLAVREDADIDKTKLFEAIKSGGYEPVGIWSVTASGELVALSP